MKKIALLADGWKRLVIYSWVDGIMSRAKEIGLDICLYHFSTNGNFSHDKKFNDGEYTLYDLPDFEQFDGVVFDCSNTVDEDQINKIVSKLQKLNIPVVSIAYDKEGFYYVGNHNQKLIREVIDHLYYKHNCRSFAFAGGPSYHHDNQKRFAAFKEAMEDYGIPVTEDMYLFGEFDFATGIKHMKTWHEEKRKLPEAFVCANDNIAAGLCSEAARLGYKIPDDFMVTGFDNLDKAAYFNPQITTVEHNRGNIGKTAVQILVDLWEGKPVDRYHFLMSEFIPGESCGCPNSGRVDYRNYIKWQIDYGEKVSEEEEDVMVLQSRIEECSSYQELYKEFADYLFSFNCDGLYILTDRELENASVDGKFSTDQYNLNNMDVTFAVEKGIGNIDITTPQELLSHTNANEESTSYMFCSIHFRDELVGCTVLKNPKFLYYNPDFFSIHSVFMKKLEALYKQRRLEKINEKLLDIYNRDVLTGLYNRFAYEEIILPRFNELNEQGLGSSIIFFDVDHFKEINDSIGHQYGDELLVKIAKSLEKYKPSDSNIFRFGGDEFVVFSDLTNEDILNEFIEKVDKELKLSDVSISHGIVITDPASDKKLDDYLVMADKEMYKNKHRI